MWKRASLLRSVLDVWVTLKSTCRMSAPCFKRVSMHRNGANRGRGPRLWLNEARFERVPLRSREAPHGGANGARSGGGAGRRGGIRPADHGGPPPADRRRAGLLRWHRPSAWTLRAVTGGTRRLNVHDHRAVCATEAVAAHGRDGAAAPLAGPRGRLRRM